MLVDVNVTDDQGHRWTGTAQLTQQADTPAPPAPPGPTTIPTGMWPQQTVVIPGVHDPAAPADLVKAYPGVRMTREFIAGGMLNTPTDAAGLVQRVRTVCVAPWAAGLVPVVSFKLDPAQVAAGRWATALTALGEALAASPPTMVIAWHEPEDDMTAAQFVTYLAAVRDGIHAGGPHVPVGYAAMAYQWAPRTSDPTKSIAGRTDDAAGWAAAQADFYAIDVYSGRSFRLDYTLPEHPGFVRWYDSMIAGKGRMWMVAERGFEAAAAQNVLRAQTMGRELAWIAAGGPTTAGLFAYIYWNTPGTEGSTSLALDQSGRAQLAALVSTLAARRTT